MRIQFCYIYIIIDSFIKLKYLTTNFVYTNSNTATIQFCYTCIYIIIDLFIKLKYLTTNFVYTNSNTATIRGHYGRI